MSGSSSATHSTLAGAEASAWLKGFPAGKVVFPESVEEVQAMVRDANRDGTSLLPGGAGTWIAAGGWARGADVVVSLGRMSRIRHYEPADLTLTGEAGVLWPDLASALTPHRQWLPIDPPGVTVGTLGGAVATGVPGPLRALYGATRDNVLGVEAVTGDGRLVKLGGRVVKNVAGYDLVRLLTGSRGSLGIITSVSVRLFPRPQADHTLIFETDRDQVAGMAEVVARAPFTFAATEILASTGLSLAVRITGSEPEVLTTGSELTGRLGGAVQRRLEGPESAEFHLQRTGWEEGADVVLRLCALPDRLDRVLALAWSLADELGGEVAAHAGQGIVRVKAVVSGEGGPDIPLPALDGLRTEMEGMNGSLIVTKAPIGTGDRWRRTGGGGQEREITQRLKALFDPNEVLVSRVPGT